MIFGNPPIAAGGTAVQPGQHLERRPIVIHEILRGQM